MWSLCLTVGPHRTVTLMDLSTGVRANSQPSLFVVGHVTAVIWWPRSPQYGGTHCYMRCRYNYGSVRPQKCLQSRSVSFPTLAPTSASSSAYSRLSVVIRHQIVKLYDTGSPVIRAIPKRTNSKEFSMFNRMLAIVRLCILCSLSNYLSSLCIRF